MYSTIFIISGPSGAGEDSIIEGLTRILPIERVVTTTTREPRRGEFQKHPYYFTTQTNFEQSIQKGELIEYAKQYNNHWYGVTKEEIDRVAVSGKIGIWKIEYQGVMTIKKLFPEIKSILITAPSLAILENRIRRRDNASPVYIQERMDYTKQWMLHIDVYDYTVVNEEGKLKQAIEEVKAILTQQLS